MTTKTNKLKIKTPRAQKGWLATSRTQKTSMRGIYELKNRSHRTGILAIAGIVSFLLSCALFVIYELAAGKYTRKGVYKEPVFFPEVTKRVVQKFYRFRKLLYR